MRKAVITLIVSGMFLASTMFNPVLAHKVNVFAWVEGDTVFVEGYYSGKKKAKNSLVEVFNEAGTKLVEGRTNEKGEFSFKIPAKTDLRIVLTAGMGHKNDFIVKASDLGGTAPSPAEPIPEIKRNGADSSTVSVDVDQLEAMIDQALDRKLDPLIKLIRNTRKEGPTVTEIIGGIGYIFGLVGVAIYFTSRKKKERG